MDPTRFDELARAVVHPRSRRGLLGAVLGGALGATALAPAHESAARPRQKKPHKPKKCGVGETRCNGKCANLQTNKKHCGSCGNACGDSGDIECCGGDCANLASDAFNCGACGNVCDQGFDCVQRQCVKRCEEGEIRCLTRCVDLQSDPRNCGTCSHNCAENEICQGGQCVCPAPVCNLPSGGQRCCPASAIGGSCCDTGFCCPQGSYCVADGCCPNDTFSCFDGRCCPFGTTCGGDCGQDCCRV